MLACKLNSYPPIKHLSSRGGDVENNGRSVAGYREFEDGPDTVSLGNGNDPQRVKQIIDLKEKR